MPVFPIMDYIYQNRYMRPFRSIFFYFFVAFTFCFGKPSSAQSGSKDSSRLASAIHRTTVEYLHFMGTAAPIYTGPQYVEYYLQINKGHPFFLNTDFNPGSVHYEDILYENLLIKYDIVENKIVLLNPSTTFRPSLSNDKIDYFTIKDHTFIKLEKNINHPGVPKNGFYEVLFRDAHLSLLKKENKSVQEDLNFGAASIRYVESSVNFYIERGNTFYPVNRKGQLLDLFKDKKTELRQYIRKNNPDFSNDYDNALVSVVNYYESLIK